MAQSLEFDLEHVLLGIELTYSPFLDAKETLELVTAARAFFNGQTPSGRPFHSCLAAALVKQLEALSNPKDGLEEVSHLWPLISVLSGQVELQVISKPYVTPQCLG
jgi:hypothetical protein